MGTFNFYPEFVADQVLTADHLNELFDYLDEQDRLTRRCLIGIGIVCGLEVTYTGANIGISRGAGVTSKGYLIDFAGGTYTHFRPYTLPQNPESPPPAESIINPFPYNSFTMYELIAAPEAGDTAISASAAFLANYAVVLFIEIKATNLKNCTTNDCDDKGRQITITLKPLLVKKTDLNHPAFKCNDDSDPNLSAGDLEAGKAAMPEVILRRYNVPVQPLTNAEAVLKAFHPLTQGAIQVDVVSAYSSCYFTFKGLLGINTPNPFGNLTTILVDLMSQTQGANILYSQYFYDFVDDLAKAYYEFLGEATSIITACCPCDKLFPYHLALGEANKNSKGSFTTYRNYFIYSPLFNDQKNKLAALRLLFDRMVEMVKGFDLNRAIEAAKVPIKITPSSWSRTPLSQRAIPFYYKPVPLFEKWNYEKTRYGKQKQNLSYSSDTWNTPPALNFVKEPLLYGIEPNDFFRIEGHVGKQYTEALGAIQKIRDEHSLPFDIVLVKAGEYKEGDIDLTKHSCQLNDLEIAYDIARREWEAVIGQTIEWLNENQGQARKYIKNPKNQLAIYIGKLQEAKTYMVDDLPAFIAQYTAFMSLYEWIELESESIRDTLSDLIESPPEGTNLIFVEDLIDHFDEVMMSVKKGPFRALQQEFKRRLKTIYASQFLDYYAQKHPGLDHKSGVPRGGTFILVYAQERASVSLLNVAPGTVIADFYLPYLCCSDCPPIAYVIQDVKPDPVHPTVNIVPKEFCNNDDAIYDVVCSPAGGVLTGPGVQPGTFKFKAFGLPVGDKLLTYTIEGQSATVQIKIYAPAVDPDFTIVATEQADHSFKVQLSPSITNGSKYEWYVDGNLSYTTMLVEDTFTFPEKQRLFTFELRITNGPCSPNVVAKEIILTKKDVEQNIKRNACLQGEIPFVDVPADSKLEVLDAGGLTIQDNLIIPKAGEITSTKTFTIKYKVTDKLGNVVITNLELTIIVVEPFFNMKFENIPGAESRYILTALTPNLSFAQWELLVKGVITFTANGSPALLPQHFTDIQDGILSLFIKTKTGETECSGKISIDLNQDVFQKIKSSPNGLNFPK
jgi:hypothetical protein